jgi:hypothetical protein
MEIVLNTLSIRGILKFKPGYKILLYFPNMDITAIFPCWTVTIPIKTIASAIMLNVIIITISIFV